MFRVANDVGKLVEIHVTNLAGMDEMELFRAAVMEAVDHARGKAVVVVDLRLPRVFAPEVATALEQMLKRANPKILRSAVLLAREHAIFSLQLERIIREAGNAQRRSFRDAESLEQWLHDVLAPREEARLQNFLTAGDRDERAVQET
jgi:hypothetical protein